MLYPDACMSLPLQQIGDVTWEIPREAAAGMRVPGRFYANAALLDLIRRDNALQQIVNVAHLPGIVAYALGMPDLHWGYGFPIGGVAATDPEAGGVVSPGGVGYDINCGVRLLATRLTAREVQPRLEDLLTRLVRDVPCGLGEGATRSLNRGQLETVLREGVPGAVRLGLARQVDTSRIEEGGRMDGADPSAVSERARERGQAQLGSLGAGNHFLEIQEVDEVYVPAVARVFGLDQGTIAIMIHTGSRGFGYQVCDDSLRSLRDAPRRYAIGIPDRQLVCAPVESPEGRAYLAGMRCAANYAFANRQILADAAEDGIAAVLGTSSQDLGCRLVYDVAHNIAKIEVHRVGGETRTLCVHRKGATRAFPPHHPDVPEAYAETGQPVVVPGDMGRYSFVLAGADGAMNETFGSVCHGAGRLMSRSEAQRRGNYGQLMKLMDERGIILKARGKRTAVEEAPMAYKDVADVVDVVERAGLATKVVRLRPLAVMKG